MNSTDLHIQYRMETGSWHEWHGRASDRFHSTENYSREYAKWIEERYLELVNYQKDQKEEIENLEDQIKHFEEVIDEFESHNIELQMEVDHLRES